MSRSLINPSNPDLLQLQDEGYEVEIQSGHLIIRNVPYVNSACEVKHGTLVSTLHLNGDKTQQPETHVIHFAGEYPCDKDGNRISTIENSSSRREIVSELFIDHDFSSKPKSGYKDYHHKMTTYINILSAPAQYIDKKATARTHPVIVEENPDSVFKYAETASSHAEISVATERLKMEKIAIIGLGGTGSYILDFVAKTPVEEIHLFDDDNLVQRNAFRMPGAASKKDLEKRYKKVKYLKKQYGAMRNHITVHATYIDEANVNKLKGMTFVFICIDKASAKETIINYLESEGISFIDVGMGLHKNEDNKISGTVRVTTSTAEKRETRKCISFSGNDQDDVYTKNIQIAELNALNACLAIIRWKKTLGFYFVYSEEYNSEYVIDSNALNNMRSPCHEQTH